MHVDAFQRSCPPVSSAEHQRLDDEHLFLRKDATSICIYSIETKSCERDLVLTTE
jgi:hypothetical protein